MTRPNGVSTSYNYDSVSRLLTVLHRASGSTVDGATYTYDAGNNRTSKLNQLTGSVENYSYDPIYQLTQVVQGANTIGAYTYDSVGNRLSSLGVSPYANNSSNQLTSTPGTTFTYDNNGSVLTKVDSSGTTSYAWDFENRLTSITLPSSGGTVAFKYDPFGRRVQKSSVAGTVIYAYDGFAMTEEVDGTGVVLARYLQGSGIDETLAESSGDTTAFYEADDLGSITSLSAASGSILSSYTYDAFGKPTTSAGTLSNPFRYTGREFDAETGLHYYRARYYDATIGRFISEDPVGFDGGVNFYAYVSNNPIGYVDPFGLLKKCITKIMLVTAYSTEAHNAVADQSFVRRERRHGRRGTPRPGTVAAANTNPPPYAFGCSVRVFDANTGHTDYRGEIHDLGSGWNSKPGHHDVLPDAWIDIWMTPRQKAKVWGKKYRTVKCAAMTANNRVLAIVLVAGVGLSMLAAESRNSAKFPVPGRDAMSPDGRYSVHGVYSGETEHPLILRDLKIHADRMLYRYRRSVSTLWSADSRKVIVNDYAGSDYTNNFVFFVDQGTPTIDLRKEITEHSGSAKKSIDGNDHVYMAASWLNKDRLRVLVWGHGEVDRKGFCLCYRYTLNGTAERCAKRVGGVDPEQQCDRAAP